MNGTRATAAAPPIAVIGMSGSFPLARDLDEYWQNLCSGRECISFFGEDGVAADLLSADDEHFVPAGGFLADVDEFDAQFFGYNARDAEGMDPQHRIFLECAWRALERAGYNPDTYPGSIGVWAGSAMSSYLTQYYASHPDLASVDHYGLAIGNDKDHLTTQVSYKLNLRGPSVTVQTACSTSLVSVCLACQALHDQHCDIALAGGVSADIDTGEGYYYQPGSILSPDGHCRPFADAAAGTVPSNGVGVVVLKRLDDALADRDHVHAVIKGYGINNDGSRKVGYTAPSVDGQAEVIAMAQEMASCDPGTIGYVEAHGTGTLLGDPIEIAALEKVFSRATSRRQFCAIGSVKSNLGHLDTAAGVASLIKTVLMLEHGLIPPSLHSERPNPRIDFEHSAFHVNTALTRWNPGDAPRRAGVSSFGIGGTNAHLVLEEAPTIPPSGAALPYALVTLSARSPEALERATDDLADDLARRPDLDLADVAYTLMAGRKAFEHRRVAVLDRSDNAAAAAALHRRASPRVASGHGRAGSTTPVVFLFPGQGAQVVDMARGAYECEPTFRIQVDSCCEALRPRLGVDLRLLLYPPADRRDQAQYELQQTALTQPALFVVEYALAQLWSAWGIVPDAMAGHSLGEYVAACCSGVLSLEDALSVVAERGRLMQAAEPGAMLAVPVSEAALAPYLGADLSLAAVNGPTACVASGTTEAVDDLAARLSARRIESRRLRTSHAYHSRLMDPVVGPLVDTLAAVTLNPPQVPYLSNVTGGWITPDSAMNPRYWGLQLRQTVRFADELDELLRDTKAAVLLEVGPGRTLCDLARSHPERRSSHVVASSLRTPGGSAHDVASLLQARGILWLHGIDGSPERMFRHEQRRRVPLPTYPFEHERYWLDGGPGQLAETAPTADVPGPTGPNAESSFYRLGWVPAGPRAARRGADGDVPTRRWLVLHDRRPFAEEVVRRLAASGHEMIQVVPGEDFEEQAGGPVVIRPGCAEDYLRLLSRLGDQGRLPDRVVHLWALTDVADAGGLDRSNRLGFLSLVHLAQAVERLAAPATHVDVIAAEVHDVVGTETLVPATACLLGACRVIPQEHPRITCRLIDVESSYAGDDARAGALVAELTDATDDPVVAHRRGRRWLPTIDRVQLDPLPTQARIRAGGVYLVTGGLGRVGMVHAEHLARAGAGSLVLTGRVPLPPESEWAEVAADPRHPSAARVHGLVRLRGLGTDVSYFCADAADRAAMASVVAAAQDAYGPLNGVVHAAGDPSAYASVMETDAAVLEAQLRGKARGAAVLADLVREGCIDARNLDFCMLVSSISTILGGAGLTAYAAANCYLDALAAAENRRGSVPWISVSWDAWSFGDTGADKGIVPARGEQLLARILARAPQQVAVCTDDLAERYELWVRQPWHTGGAAGGPGGAEELAVTTPARHVPPAMDHAYEAARGPEEHALVRIWEDLLGVAPIGIFDDFFELGGHSLLAIQLVSRIRQELGRECRVQLVFDAPTIAQLAALLIHATEGLGRDPQQILARVEDLSDDEARRLLSRLASAAVAGGVVGGSLDE